MKWSVEKYIGTVADLVALSVKDGRVGEPGVR